MGKIPLEDNSRREPTNADKEANWFATAFLVPEKDFLETWEKYSYDDNDTAARYLVLPKLIEKRRQMLAYK